jgi:hypothetical protein
MCDDDTTGVLPSLEAPHLETHPGHVVMLVVGCWGGKDVRLVRVGMMCRGPMGDSGDGRAEVLLS